MKEAIDEVSKKNKSLEELIKNKRTIIAKIRIALGVLLQLSYEIKDETERGSNPAGFPFGVPQEIKERTQQLLELPEDETDGMHICSETVIYF